MAPARKGGVVPGVGLCAEWARVLVDHQSGCCWGVSSRSRRGEGQAAERVGYRTKRWRWRAGARSSPRTLLHPLLRQQSTREGRLIQRFREYNRNAQDGEIERRKAEKERNQKESEERRRRSDLHPRLPALLHLPDVDPTRVPDLALKLGAVGRRLEDDFDEREEWREDQGWAKRRKSRQGQLVRNAVGTERQYRGIEG